MKEDLKNRKEDRVEKAAEVARERAVVVNKEWNDADVTGDGGVPEKELESYDPKPKKGWNGGR